MGKNEYQGLIFTNHALDRMLERGIDRKDIWETYKFPDAQDERKKNGIERRKKFKDYEVSIVYAYNEKNEPIILSAWVDPPLPGTGDQKEKEWWEKYKKAGFWGKLFLSFQKQIGL